MKKSLLISSVFGLMLISATAWAQITVPTNFPTINAAIAAVSSGTTITVLAGTYPENVVVTKSLTIQGVGSATIINPGSGVGVTVNADNVTLQNFTVNGATGSITHHGIWVNGHSGLTILNVTATNNSGSGIALRNVSATVVTNVTATGNNNQGLEIGNGSVSVQVNNGTFSSNGTTGNLTTGGGIMIYADPGQTTNGTSINGTVTANGNTTAGIYLFCDATGHINNTVIGSAGTITLNNNGTSGNGGAAVIVSGPCDNTQITANSTNTLGFDVAGLVVVGTDASGNHSPTNTIAKNCNLTGFTATSPAGTMKVTNGSTTYICTNDVDATVGNSINSAGSGFAVEDVLMHKIDNYALGLFRGPGTELYVTTNSGSIQRGINVANYLSTATPSVAITKIHVNSGTYNESVTVNKSLYILGEGGTQPIVTPPAGNVGINVTANGVTIDNLEVTGATGGLTKHGIWANGVNGLTIQNVNAHNNAGSGIALRGIPASPVSTVNECYCIK